jgi:hypothetical protein
MLSESYNSESNYTYQDEQYAKAYSEQMLREILEVLYSIVISINKGNISLKNSTIELEKIKKVMVSFCSVIHKKHVASMDYKLAVKQQFNIWENINTTFNNYIMDLLQYESASTKYIELEKATREFTDFDFQQKREYRELVEKLNNFNINANKNLNQFISLSSSYVSLSNNTNPYTINAQQIIDIFNCKYLKFAKSEENNKKFSL